MSETPSRPMRVWTGTGWEMVAGGGQGVLYAPEPPAVPKVGLIWVDSDAEFDPTDLSNFYTKPEADSRFAPVAAQWVQLRGHKPNTTGGTSVAWTHKEGTLVGDADPANGYMTLTKGVWQLSVYFNGPTAGSNFGMSAFNGGSWTIFNYVLGQSGMFVMNVSTDTLMVAMFLNSGGIPDDSVGSAFTAIRLGG